VFSRLHAAVDELSSLGGLPAPLEAEGIWDDIWAAEAHHSTAIEGNTLVLREVEALLREGRAVGSRELREYMEVQGYAAAARWVYAQERREPSGSRQLVSLTEVRHVHHVALQLVWEVVPHPLATSAEAPGSFRQHNIQPFHGGMKPPDWTEVHHRVSDWAAATARFGRGDRQVVEEIAEHHAEFERIHPFLDGNGRAGRLLMNLVLVRLGYPPAIVYKRERTTYLRALDRADGGDAGPLAELLARAVLQNLYRFIIPSVAGPVKLVPLAALADARVSHRALRAAAERGRLRSVRGDDGQWRSSRKWVDAYVAQRYNRAADPNGPPRSR
jgi:fido (protein-threonine AMPylation protein)